MLNTFHAIVLGIVEGVTEFLPISSTAHLILSAKLLNLPESEFLKTFDVVIQFGAILAVVFLYWKTLFKLGTIKKLIVAFIPTGFFGLLLYKVVKSVLFESTGLIVSALLVGGILLILFEIFFKPKDNGIEDISQISYKQCLAIGTFQSIAIIPGVSRSAATILGGLGMGLNRKTIVEFSFLLAVPTMFMASGFDLIQTGGNFSSDQLAFLATGFIVSFIVAYLSIKFLLNYIRKHTFIAFGVYRIVAALLLLVLL